MESTISERIYQLMEALGLSLSNFSEAVGIDKSSLSHIKTGRSKPSLEMMLKIVSRYPDISLDWLILGGGTMFKQSSDSQEPDLFTQLDSSTIKSAYKVQTTPQISVQTKSDNEKIQGLAAENPPQHYGLPRSSSKQIKKILVFYSDDTYEEFGR